MNEDTGRLAEAIILAVRCHAGQVDKGGQPYILHPLRVMLACRTETQRIAAVLHDTVEDCGLELAMIRDRFGGDIADAVDALSRRPDEEYRAFIGRCGRDAIARAVKLADLADNMDMTRLGREPTLADARRHLKYTDAYSALFNAQAIEARQGGNEVPSQDESAVPKECAQPSGGDHQ